MEFGEVYYVSDEPYDDEGHYYIIISYPSPAGAFLAASANTYKPAIHTIDSRFIIEPGEYIGFSKKTVISFEHTTRLNDEIIFKLKDAGYEINLMSKHASSELLIKIQAAFMASKDVLPKYRNYAHYFTNPLPHATLASTMRAPVPKKP